MMQQNLKHKFVEFIPDVLDDDVVYVSMEYATVTHKCCCGCGREVVTPLSPTDWKLIFNGKTISLDPSIGSWSLPCQSHYFITHNRVLWAEKWSSERINAGRAYDSMKKGKQFSATKAAPIGVKQPSAAKPPLFQKIKSWFGIK